MKKFKFLPTLLCLVIFGMCFTSKVQAQIYTIENAKFLTYIEKNSGTPQCRYDAVGQLILSTTRLNLKDFTITTYTYDPIGDMTSTVVLPFSKDKKGDLVCDARMEKEEFLKLLEKILGQLNNSTN